MNKEQAITALKLRLGTIDRYIQEYAAAFEIRKSIGGLGELKEWVARKEEVENALAIIINININNNEA